MLRVSYNIINFVITIALLKLFEVLKYYIISGEASVTCMGLNDRSLKKKGQKAKLRCWGGDLMKKAGGEETFP